MSKGVGYIAGDSLDRLQNQYGELIEAGVNVILFDRNVFLSGTKNIGELSEEEREIRAWAEVISAGQDLCGNIDDYRAPEDFADDDVLVINDLDVLSHARPDLWPVFMRLNARGVGLVILKYGFDSRGNYGDSMIEMLNKMYELGWHINKKYPDTKFISHFDLELGSLKKKYLEQLDSLIIQGKIDEDLHKKIKIYISEAAPERQINGEDELDSTIENMVNRFLRDSQVYGAGLTKREHAESVKGIVELIVEKAKSMRDLDSMLGDS